MRLGHDPAGARLSARRSAITSGDSDLSSWFVAIGLARGAAIWVASHSTNVCAS